MLRKLLILAMLVFSVSLLGIVLSAQNAANRDYISYWATGQVLVHHGNPYDPAAVLVLEKSAGFSDSRPLLMRNLPFALFLAIPLGFVGSRLGAVIWSLLIVAVIMFSIRLLWILHGRRADRRHLLGYVFPPVLACLLAGQTSAFLFLGLALFLFLIRTKPLCAGMALALCATKPHLFLPFCTVLLLWALANRAYRLLLGIALGLASTCLLAVSFRPSIWIDYRSMLGQARIDNEFIPTMSVILRFALDPSAVWLQFVPAVLACAWAIWYFLRHRPDWDWMNHGSRLMLVSVFAAPYSWFTDEVVLFPALLQGIYATDDRGCSLLPYGVVAGIPLVEVLLVVPLTSWGYIWTPAAWLGWYLMAERNRAQSA